MSQVVGLDMVTGMGFIGLEPGRLYKIGQSPKLKDQTASGNPLLLNSAEAPLTSLTVYGWSKQDGTPTPENPVPIVSAGSVMTTGAQLFNFNEVTYLRCNLQDAKTGTIKSNIINSYFCSIYIENLNEYLMENKGEQFCLRVNNNENKKISIVIYGTDESGDKTQESDVNGRFASIVINDDFTSITRLELRFNRLSEAFTDTETIIGGIMFYKGDSDIAFEPYTGGQPAANPYEGEINVTISDGGTQSQTLTLSTPGGLPGIPVTSGGNYTDENGQQWICDEVDFKRGKYVKRVWRKTFDGTESWSIYGRPTGGFHGFVLGILPESSYRKSGFCNQFIVSNIAHENTEEIWLGVNNNNIYCVGVSFYDASLEDYGLSNWKAHLAAHPLEVMTYLETPTETPLSAEEITAYKALHTYSPATTVSNDAGAWMKVGYKANA